MQGDILRNYGPDRREDGKRASNGGQMEKKEIPYSPPVGPKGQGHNSVGLGGTNCGQCGTQGRR
jgi:hypothetical protein